MSMDPFIASEIAVRPRQERPACDPIPCLVGDGHRRTTTGLPKPAGGR